MDNLILLVEDNEDDAILLKYTLESAGIFNPVHVVETAAAALKYLAGEEEYSDRRKYPFPSAAFVDLKLPGGSGLQVLEWLKKHVPAGEVLRVVLTGSDDPEDLKQSYALGANCYLQKPLTTEQLTAPNRSIRMMLARAERLAQAA
jgi:CheY-like chemotaxis protein